MSGKQKTRLASGFSFVLVRLDCFSTALSSRLNALCAALLLWDIVEGLEGLKVGAGLSFYGFQKGGAQASGLPALLLGDGATQWRYAMASGC